MSATPEPTPADYVRAALEAAAGVIDEERKCAMVKPIARRLSVSDTRAAVRLEDCTDAIRALAVDAIVASVRK